MFLRIVNVSAKNNDINNNCNDNNNGDNCKGLCNSNIVFPPKNANFEAFRCGTYLRAPFKRGRRLCQRKKNYANEILKLSHRFFRNNNE